MITVVLAALSAVAYGSSQFLTQLGLRRGRVRSSQALLVNLIAGSTCLVVAAGFAWVIDPVPLHPVGVLYYVAAGVAGPFVGRSLNFMAIKRVGATRTASLGMSEGLFAAVIGWVVLSQALSPLTIVGLIVLVVGMVLFIDETGRTLGTPRESETPPTTPLPTGPAEAPALVGVHPPGDRWRDPLGAGYAAAGMRRVTARAGGRSAVLGAMFGLGSGLFFTLAWLLRVLGLEFLPSSIIGAAIGTFVALLVTLAMVARGRRLGAVFHMPRRDAVPLAASGVAAAAAMVTFFLALELGGQLAVSTALKNLTPLITFTLAALFIARVEHISHRLGLLVLLVVLGAVLVAVGRA
ncbi:MAG: DMT family transporter [Actinobacteria bacterium]|nr:DMT family transporter [Actinomycetota bacterium]